MSLPVDTPPIVQAAARIAGPLLQHDSDESGWPVLVLLAGLVGGDQDLWALLEDPGLAATLSPETCPPEWLPFAKAINGARLTEAMTTAQRRVEVRHPSGWARGIPSTLIANIAELLAPGTTVHLFPRTHPAVSGDAPDDVTVFVQPNELVGDPLELLARVEAQMIEGDYAHVLLGCRVADESHHHTTVAARAIAHANTADAARGH